MTKKAVKWTDKGLDYLSSRSRVKGQDSELADKVIEMYVRCDLEKLSREINHEAAKVFTRDMLDTESIVVLLLGRRPKKTANGMQEHSAKLTLSETDAQKLLADALTGGWRYINKQRA